MSSHVCSAVAGHNTRHGISLPSNSVKHDHLKLAFGLQQGVQDMYLD